MISSANNPRIKHVRELRDKARTRAKEGLFLAEGVKMFAEAPVEKLREVYLSERSAPFSDEAITSKLTHLRENGVFVEEVPEEVFRKMSDTETPQGILFVASCPFYTLTDMTEKKDGKNLLLLEDVRDPGNLGTIVRTAEGAGLRGLILTKGCADIFNPKVIRSTMGSLFRVPFVITDDAADTIDRLKNAGYQIVSAHLHAEKAYDELDYSQETLFLVGNEARGLSRELIEKTDTGVIIPMAGELESLNAAVAAALLMYQARK